MVVVAARGCQLTGNEWLRHACCHLATVAAHQLHTVLQRSSRRPSGLAIGSRQPAAKPQPTYPVLQRSSRRSSRCCSASRRLPSGSSSVASSSRQPCNGEGRGGCAGDRGRFVCRMRVSRLTLLHGMPFLHGMPLELEFEMTSGKQGSVRSALAAPCRLVRLWQARIQAQPELV